MFAFEYVMYIHIYFLNVCVINFFTVSVVYIHTYSKINTNTLSSIRLTHTHTQTYTHYVLRSHKLHVNMGIRETEWETERETKRERSYCSPQFSIILHSYTHFCTMHTYISIFCIVCVERSLFFCHAKYYISIGRSYSHALTSTHTPIRARVLQKGREREI